MTYHSAQNYGVRKPLVSVFVPAFSCIMIKRPRIWTHNLKNFQFHESYQIRCPRKAAERKKQMAATIGAGLQSGELLDALSKHDSVAVSGTNLVCHSPRLC